jgi:hypothetical protein
VDWKGPDAWRLAATTSRSANPDDARTAARCADSEDRSERVADRREVTDRSNGERSEP